MAPPPPSAPAPTISLPSLPLHPPSFSQLLVRRRSSRRQLAHTPSTKTSSSSASAGSIFRRALEAVEEVGREKRVAEWRKREVREGAVESWREEVADEVASELARKEEGKEVVMELRRLIEGSEVFSSSFSPGALHLPSSPTGTPTSVSLNVSSHELEDHLTPLPLPTRTTSLGVDSAMTPARLRLSQQRFNAAAPISPPYPSLYYQFPPHDPSETLAGNSESRPSSPRLRRPRPPRDDPPPPLGSLPPKAAALLGLLPPLQLPSATPPTPTPSSFTALLPSSPILRRTAQAYPNSPSPSTTFSYIDYHLPPRPSFAITDRRGSADSTALSLAAPSTRSATASTVKSFWSSCVPGHSPSNSVSPSSAATSAGPTLPPSMLVIKIPSPSSPSSPRTDKQHRPTLSSSSPKPNTFGARRRHALEQRHGLASTSLPDLSLEALSAFSPSPASPSSRADPLEVSFRPPLYGQHSSEKTSSARVGAGTTMSKAGGKGLRLAAALGRKFSARRGQGRGRGRGRAQTAQPTTTDSRGMSMDRSREVVATTADLNLLWRAPSEEEVVEDDGDSEVRGRLSSSREGRRKTKEAWEMESEVLRMRIRENLGY